MALLAPRYLNGTNFGDISTVSPQDTNYTIYQPERYGYRIGQENIIPYVYSLIYKYQRADIDAGTHWWGRTSTDPMFLPNTAYPAIDILLSVGYTAETWNGFQLNGAGKDVTILKRPNNYDKIGGYGGFGIVPSGVNGSGQFTTSGTTFKAYWPDPLTGISTYYWEKSTDNVNWSTLTTGAGPTIPDYTISTFSPSDVGYYRCSVITNPIYTFNGGYISSLTVTVTQSGGVYSASWYLNNSTNMVYSNFYRDTNDVIIRNMTWDGNQNNNFTTNSPTNSGLAIKGQRSNISNCKFINFGVGNSVYDYPGPGVGECFVILTGPNTYTDEGGVVESCEFTSPGIKNGPDTYGHTPEYTCMACGGAGTVIKNNKFYDLEFNTNQRSPIHCMSFGGTTNAVISGNSVINVQGTVFYVDSFPVTGSSIVNNYISSSWNVLDLHSQYWANPVQISNFKNIDISNNTIILSDGPTTYAWFAGQDGTVYPSLHMNYVYVNGAADPFENVLSHNNKIKKGYYNGLAQNGWPATTSVSGYSIIVNSSTGNQYIQPTKFYSTNETFVTSFPTSSMRLSTKINQVATPGDLSYVVSKSPTNPLGTGTQTQVASISASFLNPSNGSFVVTNFKNLSKNSTYYYWLKQNATNIFYSSSQYITTSSYLGKFKTRPNGYEPYNFTASFASCMQSNTTSTIFNKIKNYNPDVFLHIGDMFYWDNSQEPASTAQHESAYQTVFASGSDYLSYGTPNPNYFPNMLRNVAIDYMWDDHDYGNNNSDGTNVNKGHASTTVATMFPHVPFTAPTTTYTSASVSVNFQPIYHSWNVGRIKFIITDNRSERSPQSDPDTPSKIIWSSTQESWFMNEIRDTRYPIKFWINTYPWEATNTAPYDGDDGWEDYTYYRQKIANFFTRFSGSIGKIITLSGDSHMTAIDDGLYSTWYGSGSRLNPPMTIYHSAPLDQVGSRKGGPYMLSGSDILRGGSTATWLTTDPDYAEAFTNLSSSYTTQNGRFACVEIDDNMTGIINIDMYSRSGNTATYSPYAGDPRFPMVNGNYRKLRLTLDVSNYLSGSGGHIQQSSSFVSVS